MQTFAWFLALAVLLAGCSASAGELVIAEGGASETTIVVSARGGKWEKRGADDLALYIERLSGARPSVAQAPGAGPAILIGSAALDAEPALKDALARVAKKDRVVRADAIVLRRSGKRVYLAGTNDESHYYAVAELLRRWGCRWYFPTDFGACIPETPRLTIGDLDFAYAPPFEIRRYWISWNGDSTGKDEFMRRNFFNDECVPNGHALARYVKDLVPQGKTIFNVPISEEKTIEHVAAKVSDAFGRGERIIMGMEDGIYSSESARDKELIAGLKDKYFMAQMLTDAFMEFYNGVARTLLKQHPQSDAKIGFLAYGNITMPPQRDIVAAKPLVAYLAAIDIDPIHGMDDPRSPMRGELKEIMYRWAQVMQGRLVIYDYDQSMLVWRDIPNPSHPAFRQDVQHYRKAGILGIDTESRNAIATTFLNLYFRGQLCWNPDLDVDAELEAFYPAFYGPAAQPMRRYWTAIYEAWTNSFVTEHEYFLIPAIYTRKLVDELRGHLTEAEKAIEPLAGRGDLTVNQKRYIERVQFTRLSFAIVDRYTAMAEAAATEGDYAAAVTAGEQTLAARESLTAMNGTFTTYKAIGENGPAWMPGEVEQYRQLRALTDGSKGNLIARTPLEWAFRRDPHDTGLSSGWAVKKPDLSWWAAVKDPGSFVSHQNNPGHWEMMRTDLYLQAQGLVSPDYHNYTGFGWYRTELTLEQAQTEGAVHLMFPGLFNECWLYVNGFLVGHRQQRGIWWYNDYAFQWDVDLRGKLKPGANAIVLRIHNPHHFGGIFRRPFLYRAAGE